MIPRVMCPWWRTSAWLGNKQKDKQILTHTIVSPMSRLHHIIYIEMRNYLQCQTFYRQEIQWPEVQSVMKYCPYDLFSKDGLPYVSIEHHGQQGFVSVQSVLQLCTVITRPLPVCRRYIIDDPEGNEGSRRGAPWCTMQRCCHHCSMLFYGCATVRYPVTPYSTNHDYNFRHRPSPSSSEHRSPSWS